MVVFFRSAPFKFTFFRFTPVRFALTSFTPLKFVPCRFAPFRFALVRLRSFRFAPLRSHPGQLFVVLSFFWSAFFYALAVPAVPKTVPKAKTKQIEIIPFRDIISLSPLRGRLKIDYQKGIVTSQSNRNPPRRMPRKVSVSGGRYFRLCECLLAPFLA